MSDLKLEIGRGCSTIGCNVVAMQSPWCTCVLCSTCMKVAYIAKQCTACRTPTGIASQWEDVKLLFLTRRIGARETSILARMN